MPRTRPPGNRGGNRSRPERTGNSNGLKGPGKGRRKQDRPEPGPFCFHDNHGGVVQRENACLASRRRGFDSLHFHQTSTKSSGAGARVGSPPPLQPNTSAWPNLERHRSPKPAIAGSSPAALARTSTKTSGTEAGRLRKNPRLRSNPPRVRGQTGKAPVSKTGDCRFESCRTRQKSQINNSKDDHGNPNGS